ncbi:560_t:CDS:1 [Gigaspora margarita]|uniref:560_t:CDS:1 n=1 Tax=Gigaspora margarita TaxID=4874 RepID=A0ABM8W5Y8_GIGMA|nr:560_t:CDS:1 [Gigaspora margarita]
MMLSDSHPMISNFRFFNLFNQLALQIGNYRITEDRSSDLIGDKNGIQIIVQTKSSKTGQYSGLEKEFKKFINAMKTRRSAKEIEIFVVTNNIKMENLKNITSTKRKIIICQFNELDGYIEQIEQKHDQTMLELYNNIIKAKNAITSSTSTEELRDNLNKITEHLERKCDINNIFTCNIKRYNNIRNLENALNNSLNKLLVC